MIISFQGDYHFLSNFYEAPLLFDGRQYRNSESAYQAAKFPTDQFRFSDLTGAQAKKLAKENKAFIRADWEEVNLGVMIEVVHAKFTQSIELRTNLVATFPQPIVEGNNWNDYFWGVCDGQGENWLGRILMAERCYWLEMANNGYRGDFDVQS